jgi:hypothetical protein
MRYRPIWKWGLAPLAIGFALLAASSWAADEIVLGSVIAQTGKYAREGKFYVDAYTLTVDAVNKASGVKVGGKPYKLVLTFLKLTIAPQISQRFYVMGHRRVVFEGRPDELTADAAIRKEWLEV